MQNSDKFYSGGTTCSWLLSSTAGSRRYNFVVDMSRVGPGARLRVADVSAAGDGDAAREYSGFSSAIDNSLLLSAREVLLTFEAEAGARAAPGPEVTVQVLEPDTGVSADTVRRIIFAGTFTLIGVYIISAAIAWRRFKVMDGRRQDNERVAARCAPQPQRQPAVVCFRCVIGFRWLHHRSTSACCEPGFSMCTHTFVG